MAAQNIVGLGIDLTSFTEKKKNTLNEFIALFEKLQKYDGAKFNPVMGEGLTSFNKALQTTSKLVDELNTKISSLGSSMNSNIANKINEANNALKGNNQTSSEAEKLKQKLAQADATSAKEAAALKVQLAEVKKALLEEARANNEAYKARMANIESLKQQKLQEAQAAAEIKKAAKEMQDEKKRLDKEASKESVAAAREAAAEEKRLLKERQQAAKQAAKDQADAAKKAAKEKIEADRAATKEALKNHKTIEEALKAEQRLQEQNRNKHQQLKSVLKDQQQTYVNNFVEFGTDDPRTKKSLREAQETASILDGINVDLRTSEGGLSAVGKQLTSAFSTIRTLAYVLPGLGIAGIFNMAFEAIGAAAKELGLFNSAIEKQSKLTIAVNTSLQDQLSILIAVVEKIRELNELDGQSITNQYKRVNIDKARGIAQNEILDKELEVAKNDRDKSLKVLYTTVGGPANINKAIGDQLSKVQVYTKQLQEAQREEIRHQQILAKVPASKQEKANPYFSLFSRDQLEAFKLQAESNLKLANDKYKILLTYAQDYYTAIDNLSVKFAEQQKFKEDEARRQSIETAKARLSVEQTISEKTLADDVNSQKRKQAALRKILADQKEINKLDERNVLENNSSTPADIAIAKEKRRTEDKKAELKHREQLTKLNEEYHQRFIKAQTDINKNELEASAIKNEKLFKDDNQTLEDRFRAYLNYLSKKQSVQNLEYARDVDKRGLRADDPTVKKEIESLASNRDTQKANIQADAERQVFEIVASSLQKRFKLVKDENDRENRENTRAYAEELNNLNKSFEKKNIKFEEYKRKRDALDKKYTLSGMDEEIADDKADISRIQTELSRLKGEKSASDKEVEEEGIKLDYVKTSGDGSLLDAEKSYDTVLGKNKAIAKQILEVEKELDKEKMELEDDELKRAKRKYDLLISYQAEYAANNRAIVDGLFNLYKTYEDAQFQSQMQKIQEQNASVQEQYGLEEAAVEKSSLNAKDKAALDIQLAAEKMVANKNAEAQEKKLKQDKAAFDRKLAIAHILWNTADSVSAALTIPPPAGEILAAQRAILGGIQIATVMATEVPSYEFGTEHHPGGKARYGEAGPEIVKEPYKSPYLVTRETVSDLPKGTQVIPIKDSPVFGVAAKDDGWEQAKYIAKQFRKGQREVKTVIKNTVNVDLGFELHKNKLLYGN
jgi:hypothetical protein